MSHTSADSSDVVYSVRHRKTNKRFACKRISKHQPDYGGSCMRCVAHPPFLASTQGKHADMFMSCGCPAPFPIDAIVLGSVWEL